ncbi:hypothetical protein MTATph1_CDS0215 [Moorella phage MTATph1]
MLEFLQYSFEFLLRIILNQRNKLLFLSTHACVFTVSILQV